jgi:hypothetical protein
MGTHLSFDGYCVRWKWRGAAPADATLVSRGRLVRPTGHYVDAPHVSIYHSPTAGYGYQD